MTIATAGFALLFLVGPCAAQDDAPPPVLACNPKAIDAAKRPHYASLTKQIRLAIRGRHGTPDGYAYKMDGKMIGLQEVAEWIAMERLCCPFLSFQLSTSGQTEDLLL